MKDSQIIKKRLTAIQRYFNPEKTTYKVIENVVNNDLSYNDMLMQLSKIKGFSKYPEDLKNEYISIINDIKKNIIKQRKKEEKERQEANTKELKDIISSLEKTKTLYLEKKSDSNIVKETKENKEEKTKNVEKIEPKKTNKENNYDKKEQKDIDDEKILKTKKYLIRGIIVMTILTIIILLFY